MQLKVAMSNPPPPIGAATRGHESTRLRVTGQSKPPISQPATHTLLHAPRSARLQPPPMCEPEPRGSKLRLHIRRDKRPVDSAITARRAQKHAVEQRPTEAGAARPHAAIENVKLTAVNGVSQQCMCRLQHHRGAPGQRKHWCCL